MDVAALGLKRIREQQFVMEELSDSITIELMNVTQHKVSLKRVIDWMTCKSARSPKDAAMKAGFGRGDRLGAAGRNLGGRERAETNDEDPAQLSLCPCNSISSACSIDPANAIPPELTK